MAPTHDRVLTPDEVLLTAADVATVLGVSRRTVERATSDGLLPHRAIGTGTRCARYTHEDVRVYLDRVRREGR